MRLFHETYIYLLYSFMKLYDRSIKFVKNVTTTVPSDQVTLNMEVVDHEKLWNIVVYNFLYEIILSMKFKFESLKFEFQIS
jgi:hypothetical protein